jgi:hypothetical protein
LERIEPRSAEGEAAGQCPRHPDTPALGICNRCGSYYCAGCVKTIGGKPLCADCLAIPGIDYLAEARAKAWGKRDGWIWYLGLVGTIGSLTNLSDAIDHQRWSHAIGGLCSAVLFGSYFFKQPWSRKGLFVLIPFMLLNAVWTPIPDDLDPRLVRRDVLVLIVGTSVLIYALFVSAAYRSTRNRLAFKIEVTDRELERYYDRYVSNPSAGRALVYGALSIPMPLLAPVALVLGVLAWRRAAPRAWPPARGRDLAIVGMVCAGLSVLVWTSVAIVITTR